VAIGYLLSLCFCFFVLTHPFPLSTLFPYTTLFRSPSFSSGRRAVFSSPSSGCFCFRLARKACSMPFHPSCRIVFPFAVNVWPSRSEEHTSELQSRFDLVCRLLLEKTKNNT